MELKTADLGEKETKAAIGKNTSLLNQVVTIVSVIAGYFIGRYLGLLVILIFIAAYAIGAWFPNWYMKREKPNSTLIKWVVWSNVVTWFLPPLGILTGFAALEFSDHFPEKKAYKVLAVVGIGLALINAIVGIWMNLQ